MPATLVLTSRCWVPYWTRPATPARRRWAGKASCKAIAMPASRSSRWAGNRPRPYRRRCAMARMALPGYAASSDAGPAGVRPGGFLSTPQSIL
ncbi:hypothetical protein G6F58_013842 [Rhizopus delemar]|nr:hypothetical protein G6F58_013842 [Rhizopus delemar]